MKNRVARIILACVLLASFALGATGTVTFAKEETQSVGDADKDRLIGVFITMDHLDLFDFESYFNDHADKLLSGGEISQSDSAPYEGRLYATLVDDPYTNPNTGETTTTKRYSFEGVEGIGCFVAWYADEHGAFWTTNGDEAISDGQMGITSTDAGDSIDLRGTVYISVAKGPDALYYNPVYQAPTGEVYLTAGVGMSYGGAIVAGMGGSHSMKDEQTVTVNGKRETISTNIEVSVSYMDTPTGTSVLQFAPDGSVIASQSYEPGAFPDSLTAEPETAYLIVETGMRSAEGAETVSRELFQPDDESLFAFVCREDGICVKQYGSLAWGRSEAL